MIWDIVCHIDGEESFNPQETEAAERLDFYLGATNIERRIREDIDIVFARNHCNPTPLTRELLNIALIVYSTDRTIRREWGYQNWERGLNIHLPVTHFGHWNEATSKLQYLLNFLTDDRWKFYFHKGENKKNVNGESSNLKNPYSAATLFSGGLDSFIGGIDLLERNDKLVAFVSHHSQSGQIKTIQREVLSLLNKHYPNRGVEFNFFVQPPSVDWELEYSSRSRSFLFLSLAVAVASSVNCESVLISENGYMSLNVPLTRSRVGSHSTRTTHPHFLAEFQAMLDILGLSVSVKNMYKFFTKGEMIEMCSNQQILNDGILYTHSCSRSTNILRYMGFSTRDHCGYCLPCLIRNAATFKAGIVDVDYIRTDRILSAQKEDIWAIKKIMSLYGSGSLNINKQLAKSGPLPNSHDKYAAVYERGLKELFNLCKKII